MFSIKYKKRGMLMTNKERFIELYKTNIKRPGSEKLLEYLLSPHSDSLKHLPVHDFMEAMMVDYLNIV